MRQSPQKKVAHWLIVLQDVVQYRQVQMLPVSPPVRVTRATHSRVPAIIPAQIYAPIPVWIHAPTPAPRVIHVAHAARLVPLPAEVHAR